MGTSGKLRFVQNAVIIAEQQLIHKLPLRQTGRCCVNQVNGGLRWKKSRKEK